METMNRHKLREIAMTSLYQHLLLNKDIRECVYENAESNEIDQFLYTITMDTVKYKDAYIKKISEHLSSEWTFDRLGYVEQAILLMACCEIDLEIVRKNRLNLNRFIKMKLLWKKRLKPWQKKSTVQTA